VLTPETHWKHILNDPAPQLIFLKASLRNHVTSRDSVSLHFTTSVGGGPANDLYCFFQ
jgi:hypothetical protein